MQQQVSIEVGRQLPRWGPAAAGDGFLALLQRREPGAVEFTASDHGLVIGLSPIAKREVRTGGTRAAQFRSPVGAITIIPCLADHRGTWSDPKECVHLAFAPRRFEEIARHNYETDRVELYPVGDQRSDKLLLGYARALERELKEDHPLRALCVESLSLLVMAHLVRSYSSIGGKPERAPKSAGLAPRARREVLEYLSAHCCDSLKIADLAGVVKLAPSSFMRAFREEFGVSALQYVLRLRVAKAEALLRRNDTDIASIALATGFSSQSHFTTTYRRLLGCTPAQTRRQLRL